jgi:hypothetical protein
MEKPEGPAAEILDAIYQERQRQKELVKQGKFLWDCSTNTRTNSDKLTVLAEEFGEVSKEVCEEMIVRDKQYRERRAAYSEIEKLKALAKAHTADAVVRAARIREELIQVAAVCIAWLEGL